MDVKVVRLIGADTNPGDAGLIQPFSPVRSHVSRTKAAAKTEEVAG
ncbi:hypothetical protein [Saccharopolyspora sp. NPDC049426]